MHILRRAAGAFIDLVNKLRHLIRETVMSVDGVTDVSEILFNIDKKSRRASVEITFNTDEDSFREEVKIPWQNMA